MKKLIVLSCFLFFACACFAQDSNPDGELRKPVLTFLIGLQDGRAENIIKNMNESIDSDASLGGYSLFGEMLYPATKHISLIFRINMNSQTYSWPETPIFLAEENKLKTYDFKFGIRFFTR